MWLFTSLAVELNKLFVNDWGSTDAPLVSISLKQEKAQGGKAKSFLQKFKPEQVEGMPPAEYQLNSEELKYNEDQYDEAINSIHRSLHLKLDDHEKRRVTAVFDQVDILKKEVSQLQESLQNSYVKIKELRAQVNYYEKRNGPQLEFKF